MPFKTKQALKICIQTTHQACLGSMLRPLGPHVGRGAHRSKPRTTWSTRLKDCKTVQSPPGVPMNGCTFSLHDHSPISINTSGPVWGRTRPAQHIPAKLLAPNRDHRRGVQLISAHRFMLQYGGACTVSRRHGILLTCGRFSSLVK
jgi:hypothetical protein